MGRRQPLALISRTTRIRVVLVVLFCAIAFTGCARSPAHHTIRVVEVVDGDTVLVTTAAGEETIRLLGIDTPESVDPNRPIQCFGAEATARLTELTPPGSIIELQRDVEPRDRYGRLLAYVHRDGVFVNLELVREGYADVSIIEPNSTHRAQFEAALLGARTAERGLWGACGGPDVSVEPPWPTTG